MVKDEVLTVKDAVHKLQLCLLEGVKDEKLLSAAGSLMSRNDYRDVVTERTIAKMCGYPLCGNCLPSERPWKGRYRISLKEHRVYDLEETYMYCSSGCLINSRTFAGSLQEERSSSLNPGKLRELLKLFDGSSSDSVTDMGKNGDLGMSELKIQEKMDTKTGEVSLEEWIGPSNAIDGYVPWKDRNSVPKRASNFKKAGRQKQVEPKPKPAQPDLLDILRDDMSFSTIIMGDEYNISKKQVEPEPGRSQPDLSDISCADMNFTSTIIMGDEHSVSKNQVVTESKPRGAQPKFSDILLDDMNFTSTIIMGDEYSISKHAPGLKADKSEGKTNMKHAKDGGKAKQTHAIPLPNAQVTRSQKSNKNKNVTIEKDKLCISKDVSGASLTDHNRNAVATGSTSLKSSLKQSVSDRAAQSVTWADEQICEYSELQDKKAAALPSSMDKKMGEEESYRFVSVEACAMGLSQAAEAVASGKSDVPDALSEAGITILPPADSADKAKILENADDVETDPILENADDVETDPMIMKWPIKPGFSNDDLFDSEDSWYENPPEGFSLALSPFSTMFMALFSWLSSSSLAYIYGRDESSHTDFLSVNGREYPRKIVLSDGLSSEIKQTLSGCLSRTLPEFVAELRLPIPISTLEQGMGRLVETMSFVDSLPAFRKKQWQVIVLLFLDALSVSRITSLTQHIMGRRILLPKVLDGAQISAEEYEIMKDLIIPLGRVPAFSSQSGG